MTAYDDLATPAQMREDCRAAGRNLRLERAADRIGRPAPSILFEDFPREVPKREITDLRRARQRLANALRSCTSTDSGSARRLSGSCPRTRTSPWRWGCRS